MPEIILRDSSDIEAAERALEDLRIVKDHLRAAVSRAKMAAVDLDQLAQFATAMEREVDMTIVDTCLNEVITDIERALNTPLPVVSREGRVLGRVQHRYGY